VEAQFNPMYLGNFIFGGLIGLLIVDPASGCMWRISEDKIHFNLRNYSETVSPVMTQPPEVVVHRQDSSSRTRSSSEPPRRLDINGRPINRQQPRVRPSEYVSSSPVVPVDEEPPPAPVTIPPVRAQELSWVEFDALVKSRRVVFVEFYTDRAPAKDPVIDELAGEFINMDSGTSSRAPVVIARFNLSRDRAKISQYNIKNVPTFIVFKDGYVHSRFVGTRPKGVFAEAIQSARFQQY